ncbi:hypothetical protein [Acuticoccus yangtzensis]|uniref:hypothetical protein n=1 Tax=Acuticoccus yangtzensis TaxID=1443441 RepID=UPI0009497294|nr:hypothetical protein [Acuticoccus yangtzensis]
MIERAIIRRDKSGRDGTAGSTATCAEIVSSAFARALTTQAPAGCAMAALGASVDAVTTTTTTTTATAGARAGASRTAARGHG